MKKLLTIALTLALILGLTACGAGANKPDDPGTNPGGQTQTDPGTDPGGQTDPGTDPGGQTDPGTDPGTGSAAPDGTLRFIDLDDRDSSVLRGVRFSGNRCGSEEFNSKAPATEGIRCIFGLNEYVACLPDTDVTSGIRIYVLPQREDQKSYETEAFSGEMPELVAVYDMEQREGDDWGEFYINPDDARPGYYDFVFVYEGKAIATLATHFYGEGQLDGLTDQELLDRMA